MPKPPVVPTLHIVVADRDVARSTPSLSYAVWLLHLLIVLSCSYFPAFEFDIFNQLYQLLPVAVDGVKHGLFTFFPYLLLSCHKALYQIFKCVFKGIFEGEFVGGKI